MDGASEAGRRSAAIPTTEEEDRKKERSVVVGGCIKIRKEKSKVLSCLLPRSKNLLEREEGEKEEEKTFFGGCRQLWKASPQVIGMECLPDQGEKRWARRHFLFFFCSSDFSLSTALN